MQAGRQAGRQAAGHPPEVARQVLLNLFLCGRLWGLGPQQRHHAHDEAGGAEPALAAVGLGQPLLHGVHAVAGVAHPLHGHHVHALHSIQRAQAGVDGAVVQAAVGLGAGYHDRAGAAPALAAPQLGPCQTDLCGQQGGWQAGEVVGEGQPGRGGRKLRGGWRRRRRQRN